MTKNKTIEVTQNKKIPKRETQTQKFNNRMFINILDKNYRRPIYCYW